MEPKQQSEIQLGHLCNNRCVFCESGRLTALGLARPQPQEPFLEALRASYAAGDRRVTFVGGEPTLVPGLVDLVRAAAEMGFEEVVVFSNGVRTARESYLDALREAGRGRLRLRLSFQGGDRESHERTTQREGSFERLLRTLDVAAARGVPVSVNTCVARSNHASLPLLPSLFAGRGVTQVHADMAHDPGDLSMDALGAMMPRFSEAAPSLLAMVRGFPEGFDVNVGNFPFCVEPRIAPVTRHDGEATTLVVNESHGVVEPRDKYGLRDDQRVKAPGCAGCVLDRRCAGVPAVYADLYGLDELAPLTASRLLASAPPARVFDAHVAPLLEDVLRAWEPPDGCGDLRVVRRDGSVSVEASLSASDTLSVRLVPPGAGVAGRALCAVELVAWPTDATRARRFLSALWERVAAVGGEELHPLGDDVEVTLAPRVAARLRRLRDASPFAPLRWTSVRAMEGGARVELDLDAGDGASAVVWLASSAPEVGYALRGEHASREKALRQGLGALLGALRSGGHAGV